MLQPDGGWWRFPDADRLTTDGDDDGLELAEADQLSAPEIGDDDFVHAAHQQVKLLLIRLPRPCTLTTQHSSEAVHPVLILAGIFFVMSITSCFLPACCGGLACQHGK